MKILKITAWLATLLIAGAMALPAIAQDASTPDYLKTNDDTWHGLIEPYAWGVGINGDLTVKNQTISVDESFGDLVKYANFAGSLLGTVSNDHFVAYGQADYFSLSTSQLNNPPAPGEVTMKTYIYQVEAGYRFDGSNGKKYDLMAGLRTVSIHGTITLNPNMILPTGFYGSNTRNVTDAIIMFRPYIPLGANWAFSPTIDAGGGQSMLTYELWPQFQWKFADHWLASAGYRQLYYRTSNNNGIMWDGKFKGFMLGVGGYW
ncbi:MAG: hypothetical protein WBR29_12775 [Gammaproteobacteria bacterium]